MSPTASIFLHIHHFCRLAKLIAHAPTRHGALAQLTAALRRTTVLGVHTNVPFLLAVLQHPVFVDGRDVSTHFVATHMPLAAPPVTRADVEFLCVGVTLLHWQLRDDG